MNAKRKGRRATIGADSDDRWDQIAEEAIREAEKVPCGLEEFARGLQVMEGTIRDRRQMAESEVEYHKANEEED